MYTVIPTLLNWYLRVKSDVIKSRYGGGGGALYFISITTCLFYITHVCTQLTRNYIFVK